MKISGKKIGTRYLTMNDIEPGDCFIFSNDTNSTEGATIYLMLDYGYCSISDGTFYDGGNGECCELPVQPVVCELVLK